MPYNWLRTRSSAHTRYRPYNFGTLLQPNEDGLGVEPDDGDGKHDNGEDEDACQRTKQERTMSTEQRDLAADTVINMNISDKGMVKMGTTHTSLENNSNSFIITKPISLQGSYEI